MDWNRGTSEAVEPSFSAATPADTPGLLTRPWPLKRSFMETSRVGVGTNTAGITILA
jgi:hypothetical protein